jgi:hypothetical protein
MTDLMLLANWRAVDHRIAFTAISTLRRQAGVASFAEVGQRRASPTPPIPSNQASRAKS